MAVAQYTNSKKQNEFLNWFLPRFVFSALYFFPTSKRPRERVKESEREWENHSIETNKSKLFVVDFVVVICCCCVCVFFFTSILSKCHKKDLFYRVYTSKCIKCVCAPLACSFPLCIDDEDHFSDGTYWFWFGPFLFSEKQPMTTIETLIMLIQRKNKIFFAHIKIRMRYLFLFSLS